MSGTWGKNIRYSIFGESHGNGIGIVIDGLPAGMELDFDLINKEMARRAPGSTNLGTPRKEPDKPEIMSGYFNNHTTGTPLCAVIKNTNTQSKDYTNLMDAVRPGHADYPGRIKYENFNDHRGGGHFSGRITAGLVFAGAIAKQILMQKNIDFVSHVYSIHNITDEKFNKVSIDETLIQSLKAQAFPVINEDKSQLMQEAILKAKEEENSLGGIVECAILNMPAGIGEPFFDSLESTLSHLLFSVPAVKALEFGEGFEIAAMKGSEANDPYYFENGNVKTTSNNNGGILGGISSGMPIVFRCAIKPTASISIEQDSVNLDTCENVKLTVKGRHDPCIVPRVLPVIEAVSAMAVLEHIITRLDKIS
jgi:chorismate synthase